MDQIGDEKNKDEKHFPASMTKMMGMYLVLKNVENYKIEDDYFRKSSYNLKTLAETIRIKQDGERKAWGLDSATDEDNTTPQQTLEQLNAIYEMAMQKANDDKQKMLERFNSVS